MKPKLKDEFFEVTFVVNVKDVPLRKDRGIVSRGLTREAGLSKFMEQCGIENYKVNIIKFKKPRKDMEEYVFRSYTNCDTIQEINKFLPIPIKIKLKK